ncbi:hypothetical protein TWF569_008097 [Orbilia oligospora]|uniref:Uncharacterized protein n=1 Tax=Orbilia oligospora TaxID=2813651 RepID=A0A7C8JGA2_ORBOL|nr:hypothetical protein TWF706_009097 [Orbilia oligospora]KAF3100262.1 hypothetical protein TWF103_008283 [Orbilia oligospora]KAF3112660.1 hypothetical protein TWF102_004062 [Orbilia oligospora]KAF3120034.1 hypothetical protein TWF594_004414 [Orbilia oligospora]KAF3141215.1 hypothetical protein TWF569_008097 [Orbilia oligospora]
MTQQLQPRSSKTPDFPRTGIISGITSGFEACVYGDQSIDTITIGLGKGGEMILWYFEDLSAGLHCSCDVTLGRMHKFLSFVTTQGT